MRTHLQHLGFFYTISHTPANESVELPLPLSCTSIVPSTCSVTEISVQCPANACYIQNNRLSLIESAIENGRK